jgi:hypothetical protein
MAVALIRLATRMARGLRNRRRARAAASAVAKITSEAVSSTGYLPP